MKSKKGFTLIELLAIIVILAIIAVITVPVILNIIENSRKGAVVDSAYGYTDGLEKYYASRSVVDYNQSLPVGVYDLVDLPVDFTVNGESPISGWVEFDKGVIIDYSLNFGDYVVNFNTSTGVPEAVKNGTLEDIPSTGSGSGETPDDGSTAIIAGLTGTVKSDGAKYLSTPIEIYFNPTVGTNGEVCTSGESGCLHWYLYSVKGTYANMILDRNISTAGSSSGTWATKSDYEAGLTAQGGGFAVGEGTGSKATSAGISYPGITSFPSYSSYNNVRGPVTALNALLSLTSDWKTGIPKVPNSSSTDEHIIPSSRNLNLYQIDYTGYHARLITSQEAGYLGCTSSTGSCPTWMLNNLGSSSAPCGYWTSNATSIDDSTRAVVVDKYNNYKLLGNYRVNDTDGGIRPVITVPIVSVLSAS